MLKGEQKSTQNDKEWGEGVGEGVGERERKEEEEGRETEHTGVDAVTIAEGNTDQSRTKPLRK